ncbi:MAG: lysylphosphatidylglycerol synthase domain-containing protein [Saprospiraceae bacterium]|nr:lysylphosphatidylglycerol synthase domain-containing protein [Saprospiraceae bacterium]
MPSSAMKYIRIGLFLGLTFGFAMVIIDRLEPSNWPLNVETWPLSWPSLIWAILLVPVNWGLEMKKFHVLLGKTSAFPLLKTCQSVLAGITVSMFLPNRMGEFAGRMLFFPADERPAVVSATMTGSLLQTIWITMIGLCIVLFSGQMDMVRGLVEWSWVSVVVCLAVLIIGLIFLRYNQHLNRFFKETIEHFRNILGTAAVTSAGGWALLRYATYSIQFVLLLSFVGLDLPVTHLFIFAFAIFFLQTVLPLPPALGWMARIQFAVILGGIMVIEPVQAATASLLLWLINLLIPGFIGGTILFSNNLYKQLPDVRTTYRLH